MRAKIRYFVFLSGCNIYWTPIENVCHSIEDDCLKLEWFKNALGRSILMGCHQSDVPKIPMLMLGKQKREKTHQIVL